MDKKEETTTKKTFVSPKLTIHGDVEVITMGQSTGTKLDAPFNSGTPFNDLTFS